MKRTNRSIVLLIEENPALAEINRLALGEAGFQVRVLPPAADPVEYASSVCPSVVVAHVRPTGPDGIELIDRLQVNLATRTIPVVVLSDSPTLAAAAKAAPNVPDVVELPGDLRKVVSAVSQAMKSPPPTAALPPARHPVSLYVTRVAEALTRQARQIALKALEELRGLEPYCSRFEELSPLLADNLGIMLGAAVVGLRRDLPPDRVFSARAVRHSIDEHVYLRTTQGLGAADVIHEYQLLRQQVSQFLQSLVEQGVVSASEAFEVSRKLNRYFDELIRLVIHRYNL